jgi:hypothetical protein
MYGKEQLEIHELDNIPRVQSRRGLQEVTNEQRSLHVACSDYNQATDNERFLKLRLGEQNVYPAYVSESANAVCFAIFMKPSIASAVQDLPSIQYASRPLLLSLTLFLISPSHLALCLSSDPLFKSQLN